MAKSTILHGRDLEVKHLMDAYQKCKCPNAPSSHEAQELVLISGHSGTGKTVLANALAPIVQKDGGFFVSGKFDLATFQDPYAIFKTALSQYVDQLWSMGSSEEVSNHVAKIRQVASEAIGTEGKLLTDIVPSLERVLGKQETECCDIRKTRKSQRVRIVFSRFCRALSSIAPLVLFLDDLQWSDSASLELMEVLLQSRPHNEVKSSLLVIGSYRDEEVVAPSDINLVVGYDSLPMPLPESLHRLSTLASVHVFAITLQDLEEEATNRLVAGFLSIDEGLTVDLGHIIHTSCSGNPFHCLQLLRLLVEKDYVRKVGTSDQQWVWDGRGILSTCESTETVEDLIRQKLLCLPQITLRVLQVAACIGDEIDESAVCCALEASMSEVELSVLHAHREELLVMKQHKGQYHFAHDRIRQVILSTIHDKDAMSFHIGRQLWQRASPAYLCTKLCNLTSLLNHGVQQMTDQAERYKAASLNLEAGARSASLAAFSDSSRYFGAGMQFLKGVSGGDPWKDEYNLTLNLYSSAAEAELCCQNYNRVSELANEVLLEALSFDDKLRAYTSLISSFGQLGNLQDAIALGTQVLRQLGESLPKHICTLKERMEVTKIKLGLRGRSNESLLRISPMQNGDKLAAMYVMTTLLPYLCQAGSDYTDLITRRLVRMFLDYGFHKGCALGFTKFAYYMCESDPKEAYRIGTVALSIIERSGAREFVPRVHLYFYGFIHPWRQPLKESLAHLDDVVRFGSVIGDVEYAMRALLHLSERALHCGISLDLVEERFVEATRQMAQSKQEIFLQIARAFLKFIRILTGRCASNFLDEVISGFSSHDETSAPIVQYYKYVLGADLAFSFGDCERALQIMQERKLATSYKPVGHVITALEQFKAALICIACLRQGKCKRSTIKFAKVGLKKMKMWAKHCPENFFHKALLLEAELGSLRPTRSVSCSVQHLYDEAIQVALNDGFVQEAALGCELASNYMFRQRQAETSEKYGERARRLYLEWGAREKAKTIVIRLKQRTGKSKS